ncbi:hypothetical protein FXE80_01625 [Vibrio cholerae]|uniref:hypothetical protein n=1 Tax=Vibrio cholerae TaxID=666 RepID=UPI0011D809E2|nr:hypothetical protein [Vibrio cholerae]TXY78083.1 hypothetical protein FXE80_01625 [Vibrio cholerae]GIB17200.1 hypothetical protein VCSRO90_2922 [Vibrio cholerae]
MFKSISKISLPYAFEIHSNHAKKASSGKNGLAKAITIRGYFELTNLENTAELFVKFRKEHNRDGSYSDEFCQKLIDHLALNAARLDEGYHFQDIQGVWSLYEVHGAAKVSGDEVYSYRDKLGRILVTVERDDVMTAYRIFEKLEAYKQWLNHLKHHSGGILEATTLVNSLQNCQSPSESLVG